VKLEWDEIQSAQGFKPRFEVEGDRFELLLQSSIMLTLLTVGLEYRGVKRARDGEVEKHAVLMTSGMRGAVVPEARSAPRSSGVGLEQELTRGGGDLVFGQDSSETLSQRCDMLLQTPEPPTPQPQKTRSHTRDLSECDMALLWEAALLT
jgi:hypothetical protein